jgi:2-octaprenyl-6-methoxyphenol hydroxylase
LREAGHLDPGADQLLSQYVSRRDPDQRRVGLATDVLARLFSSPLPPLRWARNLGLLGLDLLPGSKHLFARHAMGLGTRLPNLRTELRP